MSIICCGTLATKYKPTAFAEYIIHPTIAATLRDIFATNTATKILIHGPKSSGKTTLLQTIVREYFGTNTATNPDLMCINNLTDQGLAFYQNDVKTFCQSRCGNRRHKMLVIDDLDMITEPSQHVFRQFLDKYVHNVVFVMSATSLPNIVEALQTRLQIIPLPVPAPLELSEFARHICRNERLNMSTETLDYLLRICDGSMQMLVHCVEKFVVLGCGNDDPITTDMVRNLCFNIGGTVFDEWFDVMRGAASLQDAVNYILAVHDRGYAVIDILDALFAYVRAGGVASTTTTLQFDIVELIAQYMTVFYTVHEDEIELVLFTRRLRDLLRAASVPT